MILTDTSKRLTKSFYPSSQFHNFSKSNLCDFSYKVYFENIKPYQNVRNMLHLSSCLFSTIVIHAYYLQNVIYHHLFLILTVSSILFHTTHDEIIRKIDKLLAHISFLLILTDTPKVLSVDAPWLLLFPFTAACLWFGQCFTENRRNELHLGLHLVSILGVHVYLCVLYPLKSAVGTSIGNLSPAWPQAQTEQ